MIDEFNVTNLLPQREASPTPRSRFMMFRMVRDVVMGNKPVIRLSDRAVEEKRRSVALSVGGILLVLLVVSVGFGWKHRIDVARDEKLSIIEHRARYAMKEAFGLSTLSPGRARSMILGAQTEVQQAQVSSSDSSSRSRLSGLSKELDRALVSTGRVSAVTPELYLDLGLIREKTKGSAMVLVGKNLLVLDKDAHTVLSISAVDRGGAVIGGGDAMLHARAIAGTEQHTYVLMDHAVVSIDVPESSPVTVLTDDEEIWKDPVDLASFAGNIYLLDRGTSEVYKYPVLDEGFGNRKRWFAPGIAPDLSNVQSFAVDGDAWFLFPDGVVKRFHQGAPVNFSQTGADEFGETVGLSVPNGGMRVWVLDRKNGSVVAFDRDNGEYAGQWVSDIMESATSLAVSEELGKMFLLAREKIYAVGIE